MGRRIGILSDSHGKAARTAAAVRLLLDRGADLLIHLGDVETDDVLDALVGTECHLVFGNCDDAAQLTRYAEHLGLRVDHPAGRLGIDDAIVAFTHGHIERLMLQAVQDRVDYLLHGHSHEIRDERVGATRVLNPGALHRAARYTAMILEPAAGTVEVLDVPA